MNSVKTGLKKHKILVERGIRWVLLLLGSFRGFKMGKMIVDELHGLRNDEEVGL
jgi:hypothetical protein